MEESMEVWKYGSVKSDVTSTLPYFHTSTLSMVLLNKPS